MKNKDKYNLTELSIKPMYKVNGCGKKIEDDYTFNVYINGELIARDIKAKKNTLYYLMEWLESEAE